jgi:hypothetical protein
MTAMADINDGYLRKIADGAQGSARAEAAKAELDARAATKTYESQAARDAEERGYGDESYWDYLDRASAESAAHWRSKGDDERANHMMTRSLSEALRGNDGD